MSGKRERMMRATAVDTALRDQPELRQRLEASAANRGYTTAELGEMLAAAGIAFSRSGLARWRLSVLSRPGGAPASMLAVVIRKVTELGTSELYTLALYLDRAVSRRRK
ncbi:MAG: hypothetical protein H7144_14180 [Burkholderiales bacterium]|nr:hypothetical protein [Phycisphaerae bacterium]